MRTKILFFQPLVWIILFNGRNLIFQITQNLHLMNKPKESKYASHKIAYILEGAIKEFRGFEAILFVDIGPKYVKNISSRSLKKYTLISLINVELGINVEGVQKLPNH